MSLINAKLTSGMGVQLPDGRHQWFADEPVDASGTDISPNPYVLLPGFLVAGICMTIAWYCNLRKLRLESITSKFDFSLDHARDCRDCDSNDIAGDRVIYASVLWSRSFIVQLKS
jgi:hypothetical protein